jgi:hypothetical protein
MTSRMIPYSANIQFVLYDCAKESSGRCGLAHGHAGTPFSLGHYIHRYYISTGACFFNLCTPQSISINFPLEISPPYCFYPPPLLPGRSESPELYLRVLVNEEPRNIGLCSHGSSAEDEWALSHSLCKLELFREGAQNATQGFSPLFQLCKSPG